MMKMMIVMGMVVVLGSSSWLELSALLLNVDQLHDKSNDGSLGLSDSLVAVDTSLMSLVSDDLVLELENNLLLDELEWSNLSVVVVVLLVLVLVMSNNLVVRGDNPLDDGSLDNSLGFLV